MFPSLFLARAKRRRELDRINKQLYPKFVETFPLRFPTDERSSAQTCLERTKQGIRATKRLNSRDQKEGTFEAMFVAMLVVGNDSRLKVGVEEIARAKKTGRVYERFATIKAAAGETIFQIRPRDFQGRPDVCPNTRHVSIVGKNASFCWSNERNNGLSRGTWKIVGTFCKIPTICRLLSFVVFTTTD